MSARAPVRQRALAVAVGAACVLLLGLIVLSDVVGDAQGAAAERPTGAAYRLESTIRLPEAAAWPLDVAVMPDGSTYVADGRRNAVLRFDPAGQPRGVWTEPPTGPLPGYIYVPRCVAADGGRSIVYVLWLRYRLDGADLTLSAVFLDARAPDGEPVRPLLAVTGSRLAEVADIALEAATGDIWLAGEGQLRRLRLPTGVIDAEMPLPRDASRVAVNPEGLTAVARPAAHRVDLRNAGGVLVGGWELAPNEPVAVAAGQGGRFQVLVRAPVASDPAAALLVELDPTGGTTRERASAAVGAPVPPDVDWPWALDVNGEMGVLSTGERLFQVRRFDARGPVGEPFVGTQVLDAYAPGGDETAYVAPALALARAADGSLAVLDGRDDHIVVLDGLHRVRFVAAAPAGAVDLAVGRGGDAFVSTRDDQVLRYSGLAADLDPGAPAARTGCDCDLGGRLAADGSLVHVSRSRASAVACLDGVGLGPVRTLRQADTVGLWPADLAAGADGTLFVADQVRSRVLSWSPAGEPLGEWPAGLLSGPRRLALGLLGTEPIVAAIMADGSVEVHLAGDGNLLSSFRPLAGDGGQIDAADLAVGANGRLYLADARRRAVFVFAPAPDNTLTPTATGAAPLPSATPGSLSCVVRGDKQAGPSTVVLGSAASVTLTLSADCPQSARLVGADIVLVIDRSGSMQGAKLASAREAARSFAELLDVRHHRLGLASFSDQASIDVPLTDSVPAVIDGLYALRAEGGTDLTAALERARACLEQFGRSEALPVIVLLSDGRNSDQAADPQPVAEAARAWGAQLYTVGLGADADKEALRSIAGGVGSFFDAPAPGELFPIYGQILRVVLSSLAGNLIVQDTLAPHMRYEADSAHPAAVVSRDGLRWGRSVLPSSGITLTFRLVPERAGCGPTSLEAAADYTDADGARRRYLFPIPTICALEPTPTATVAAPTATATPRPSHLYLPLLQRSHCFPVKTHADVVLVIDVSGSMTPDKLEAARSAARMFAGLLAFPLDRAAVVAFSETASVTVPMTADRGELLRGIDALATGSGTRIDRALWAALGELRRAAGPPGNRPVLVLLSDGGHSGSHADVLDLADEARSLGTVIYSIGLGSDADLALLQEIAGSAARTYFAPSAADLAEIYRQVAVVIACR